LTVVGLLTLAGDTLCKAWKGFVSLRSKCVSQHYLLDQGRVTEFVTADDIKFNDGSCSEQAARVASDMYSQADPSVNWSIVYV
jgi:hypothetical protein